MRESKKLLGGIHLPQHRPRTHSVRRIVDAAYILLWEEPPFPTLGLLGQRYWTLRFIENWTFHNATLRLSSSSSRRVDTYIEWTPMRMTISCKKVILVLCAVWIRSPTASILFLISYYNGIERPIVSVLILNWNYTMFNLMIWTSEWAVFSCLTVTNVETKLWTHTGRRICRRT